MNPSRKTRLFALGFLFGCVLAGLAIFYRFSLGPPPPEGPPPQEWRTLDIASGSNLLREFSPARHLGQPHRYGQAMEPDGFIALSAWLLRPAPESGWLRLEYDHREKSFHLFHGDRLLVQANPAIDPRMIRDGFAHLGHDILREQPEEAIYEVSVAPIPWDTLPQAEAFLATRGPYLLAAERIPVATGDIPSGP